MNCRLIRVDPEHARDAWPLVADLVASAMHKANISDLAALEQDVFAGRALLWAVVNDKDIKAAVVTQVAKANGHKYCTIIACGGKDRKDWLPLIAGIEHYAREMGCVAMRIFGRCGWSKVLPDYKIVGHITEKAFTQ